MTRDEKLAVIAGNLRDAVRGANNLQSIKRGAIFELAQIAGETDDEYSAINLAKLVLPKDECMMLADFCRLYHKYRGTAENRVQNAESAEMPDSVVIPEIARLDAALKVLSEKGITLYREYGDSFSSCAEDVEYGHHRYLLMPLSDTAEGRLRSFDRLREKYGLKIHCVMCVSDDDGETYAYQLCGLGLSDGVWFRPTRLSFSAYTESAVLDYLNGVTVFGASVLSAELEAFVNTVRAVLDISAVDDTALSGLLMYLGADAHLTIDGIYAEI